MEIIPENRIKCEEKKKERKDNKNKIGDFENRARKFNILIDTQKERSEIREEIIEELLQIIYHDRGPH